MKTIHLVLIGFMGSGKTTVGRMLAEKLNLELTDMDALIEERTGMEIRDIFRLHGEAHFRALEREVVAELAKRADSGITCTGGGVVLDERNIDNLKRTGVVVWLKASPEEIYSRIKGDTSRPVLKDNMSAEKIEKILAGRLPLYEKAADLTVMTDGKEVKRICREIIQHIDKMNL